MGFFSLKKNCSICGDEIGLNRYEIKKSNDECICPKCFKKAGGFLNAAILRKLSIEEIRELIEKNEIEKENQEILIKKKFFKISRRNVPILFR